VLSDAIYRSRFSNNIMPKESLVHLALKYPKETILSN